MPASQSHNPTPANRRRRTMVFGIIALLLVGGYVWYRLTAARQSRFPQYVLDAPVAEDIEPSQVTTLVLSRANESRTTPSLPADGISAPEPIKRHQPPIDTFTFLNSNPRQPTQQIASDEEKLQIPSNDPNRIETVGPQPDDLQQAATDILPLDSKQPASKGVQPASMQEVKGLEEPISSEWLALEPHLSNEPRQLETEPRIADRKEGGRVSSESAQFEAPIPNRLSPNRANLIPLPMNHASLAAKNNLPAASSEDEPIRKINLTSEQSWWSIASEQYGNGQYFRALYAFNLKYRQSQDEQTLDRTEVVCPKRELLHQEFPELCPLAPDQTRESKGQPRSYTTIDGDTLFGIARSQLHQASRYVELLDLNRKILPQKTGHLTPLPAGLSLELPRD